MREAICPDCTAGQHANCVGGGTGYWFDADNQMTRCICPECGEACPHCMGAGEVEKTVGITWRDVPCPECHGSGVINV